MNEMANKSKVNAGRNGYTNCHFSGMLLGAAKWKRKNEEKRKRQRGALRPNSRQNAT